MVRLAEYNLNNAVPTVENRKPFDAPTTGTTGHAESVEVVSIPNVGKVIDAPKNDSMGWSASLVKP